MVGGLPWKCNISAIIRKAAFFAARPGMEVPRNYASGSTHASNCNKIIL
jgi:hypothetical protein